MRCAIAIVLAAASGCIVARQSLEPPPNDVTTVALLTGTLGPPLNDIARHPWFAIRHTGDTKWRTFEVGGGGVEDDPFRGHRSYGDPIVHKIWRGADADAAAACLEREAPAVKQWIEGHYVFFPGPNSNTFGDVMLHTCHLHASLPSSSVGKDWRGWGGAGVTSEGTGIEVNTPLIGFKLGLKEGFELHVIGLSIGFDLWPPAIILPLGPGRLGFADR